MLTKRTSGCWKAVFDAVAKSVKRVPMPMTRSAAAAISLAPREPATPAPCRLRSWSQCIVPLPAWVSATGMPVCSAKAVMAASASL